MFSFFYDEKLTNGYMKITAYVPTSKYLAIIFKRDAKSADAVIFDSRGVGNVKDVYVTEDYLDPSFDKDQSFVYPERNITIEGKFTKFSVLRKMYPR